MIKCIGCGTSNVTLYDEYFDVFACDDECLIEFILHEDATAMYEIYKNFNVEDVEVS